MTVSHSTLGLGRETAGFRRAAAYFAVGCGKRYFRAREKFGHIDRLQLRLHIPPEGQSWVGYEAVILLEGPHEAVDLVIDDVHVASFGRHLES